MCDPVTLTLAAVSAAGSISQGNAASRQANQQADVQQYQAAVERDNAEAEAVRIRRAGEAARGQTVSAIAASGVQIGQGSALDAERQVMTDYSTDEYIAILTGERRGRAFEQQADQTRAAGRDAKRAGYFNAATSLLSAGAAGARASGGWKGTNNAPVVNRDVPGGYKP